MFLDFAPMEGVTYAPFRNAHRAVFSGVDRYFAPFVGANQTLHFKRGEKRDIDPAANDTLTMIPQVMTNKPDQFLWAVGEMKKRGYNQVNLNMGCPSRTVVTKNKGAGMLNDPDFLDRFWNEFWELFEASDVKDMSVTVKLRPGIQDMSEMPEIAKIVDRYPFDEVTLHPRLQKAGYGGVPDMEVFRTFGELCHHPLIYNGDVKTVEDIQKIVDNFPNVVGIMAGRGLIADPALFRQYKGGQKATAEEIRKFHELTLNSWLEYLKGDENAAVRKMKEVWGFAEMFRKDHEKEMKKIRKARSIGEYRDAANRIYDLM